MDDTHILCPTLDVIIIFSMIVVGVFIIKLKLLIQLAKCVCHGCQRHGVH
jgi:hypothetical protein